MKKKVETPQLKYGKAIEVLEELTAKGAIEALQKDAEILTDSIEESADNFNDEVLRLKRRTERLRKVIAEEREKVAGYEQLAKVHSAYISILLKKLGAKEDKKVEIKATEVTEALNKYEARAIATEKGFALYYTE